ncbi:MAG TPA: hypothetical protein VHZ33_39720 [Trebonia sp.]|jgi:hypothetical protein|nr:hypothetical protein [Trebonia sp.]
MKHRITIAAIATAAALGGTCAFLVPAASASPEAAKTHTLSFTSVQEAVHNYSQTVSAQQDRDVNKAGKVVGYDLLYLVFNPKKETAKLNFTAVTSGGMVYGVASASSSPVIHGMVTGGTGVFKGAAGTILAKNLNKVGTRTSVTITYHT